MPLYQEFQKGSGDSEPFVHANRWQNEPHYTRTGSSPIRLIHSGKSAIGRLS